MVVNIVIIVEEKGDFMNAYELAWQNEVVCSECSSWNDKENNYCIECGHKLRKISDDRINKKYCTICGEKVDIDAKYCSRYGHEIKVKNKIRVCEVCGEWIDGERYCINCGHDTIDRSPIVLKKGSLIDVKKEKKCENCGHDYQRYYNYCKWCGGKLVRKSFL